jgi:membrane protein YqaA with SNARE-associated domain
MPPTWSVLAIFRVTAAPPLLLLTLGGAVSSAIGRAGLALLCRRFRDRLPERDRRNADALSDFLNRHRRWRDLIVFGYCLGPFPSNPLFIAAGVGRIPLLPIVLAFFVSRAISYTFWVWTTGQVSQNLGGLFLKEFSSWQAILVQIAALASVVVLLRLPWARWLGLGSAPGDSEERGDERRRCSQPPPNAAGSAMAGRDNRRR